MVTLEQSLEIEKTVRLLDKASKEQIIGVFKRLLVLKYLQENLIKEMLIGGFPRDAQ